MKEILDQKNRGEDFEENYQLLLETRRLYDVYDQEEKETIAKQFAMQQNFIKLIDKNIDDMEADNTFLDKTYQSIMENDNIPLYYPNMNDDNEASASYSNVGNSMEVD